MQIWNPAPANAKSPFQPCPPHKVLCNSVFWEPSGESPGCPIQAFLWLEWGTGAKSLHDLVFWKTTRHGRAGLQASVRLYYRWGFSCEVSIGCCPFGQELGS